MRSMSIIKIFRIGAIFTILMCANSIKQTAYSFQSGVLNAIWICEQSQTKPDTYVAFRGRFSLPRSGDVKFHLLGATWFNAWLDEAFFAEGPARFHQDFPEYQVESVALAAGEHILAVIVHYEGVSTRILDDIKPFLACRIVTGNGEQLPIQWRCSSMDGYKPSVRRINPQLGWIEWCDTRKISEGWKAVNFDDSSWPNPVSVDPGVGKPQPLSTASTQSFYHTLQPAAKGPLAEVFGYEMDDIPARFFLRDLVCDRLPAQGVWRRYDLGRVRLGRPRFVLDLPPGAVVEFAYSESLSHGRVAPYITLSAGPSCNLDHYVARGGVQTFFPLTPKGGRFLEVHILADTSRLRFIKEEYVERGYYDLPHGSFQCNDALLNQIWDVGVETFRACAEDALIDNPTRERGQWTGDVAGVGMDIAAVGYSDIRLCRRALLQSAQCARDDGLIAGLCPGGEAYLATYAAQWVSACLHYRELTGNDEFLKTLFPYAERNLAAFEKYVTDDGLVDGLGWVFIDWGYRRNEGPADMAYNLHFITALRDMVRWCDLLGKTDDAAKYRTMQNKIEHVAEKWFDENLSQGKKGWQQIGYHSAVLGLRAGFFKGQKERDGIDYIKKHILRCFPNDPDAPRLGAPRMNNPRLITPYFAHYAFPLLIEHGEMDFVLQQYRTSWGWALRQGSATWIEVFDTRWSQCHQWSGCPTWQLSRYVLGLHTRYDLGDRHFVLSLFPGDLRHAEGSVPLPGEKGVIKIQWQKKDDGVHYDLQTPTTIYLSLDERLGEGKKTLRVDREFRHVFKNLR